MAVEFRCPACKAKLRVPTAPDPGEEVECPKCGDVFPAPDLTDADAPARDDDTEVDRPRKKKKKKKEAAAGGPPRRRKGKKKKTNPAVLAMFGVGAVVFLSFMIFVLYYFLGRTPAAVEMLSYMPGTVNTAAGVNISQLQRYVLFNKDFDNAMGKTTGWKRMDALAKAIGSERAELFDAIAAGTSADGADEVTVVRTKKEFDRESLSKLTGAKAGTVDGTNVYTTPPGAGGALSGTKVFAPTPRLIVIVPAGMKDATVREILLGKGNDNSLSARMAAFGSRVTKGNVWAFQLTGNKAAAKSDPFLSLKTDETGNKKEISGGYAKTANAVFSAVGRGIRFNVGSKLLKVEAVVWCGSTDQASEAATELRESELAKGDEGTPPAEWKQFAGSLGDKKIGLQATSTLGASASGELFLIRCEVEMALAQIAMNSWISKTVGGGDGAGQ
jgi:hypothetical protein